MLAISSLIFTLLLLFREGEAAVQNRIVNGEVADLGEFPYLVSLQINGGHNCGGLILNKYNILTAAHCVDKFNWKKYIVVIGTVNLKTPGAVHNVKEAIIHEHYDEKSGWNNDVAILRVTTPIIFNDNVAPAKLAKPGQVLRDNQTAVISGFGRLWKNGPLPPILYKTKVYIENLEQCRKYHPIDPVRPTNICTRNLDRTTGFCNGDSGGPLIIHGRVVGIVSFSLENGCATDARHPQVFTRVSKYIDWIKSKAG